LAPGVPGPAVGASAETWRPQYIGTEEVSVTTAPAGVAWKVRVLLPTATLPLSEARLLAVWSRVMVVEVVMLVTTLPFTQEVNTRDPVAVAAPVA